MRTEKSGNREWRSYFCALSDTPARDGENMQLKLQVKKNVNQN